MLIWLIIVTEQAVLHLFLYVSGFQKQKKNITKTCSH